jgi:hypothetical protein
MTPVTAAHAVEDAGAPGALTVYVSPVNGWDDGPGSAARPFRTLERARDRVRELNDDMHRDIHVALMDGTYTLTDTFRLTAADSGTNGHRVVYTAAPGAHPVISGGTRVTGWTPADPDHHVYKAHVGDVDTRQLYVDGELATRARGEDNPPGFHKTATGYTMPDTGMDEWKNPSDLEVVSRWGWMLMRCPVASISGTVMTMQQPCFHNANLHEGQEIQNPSWLENARELLDKPGEWYLDRSAGDLYYMPKPGQDLATATVTVPRVQDLVDLDGTIDRPVHDVSFQDITFSYSTWLAPSSDDGLIEGQAGFRIVGDDNPDFDSTRLEWVKTPGAVNVSHGCRISFTGNTFTHLGAVGLNLNTGTKSTSITGNVFRQIAATGIQVGGVDVIDAHPDDPRAITKDNTVSDNVVTRVADQYNGSLGIFAGYTDHTVITHNKLHDLPYSGISVGWGWGLTDQGGDTNYLPGNLAVPIWDTPTTSRNNVVSYNEISDIMKLQADGGAIYTLSANPGGVVSGNYIKGVPPLAYGAVYHDEGSRYWHTTGNAMCDVAFQWLLLNHGMDITADHNFITQPHFSTQLNSTDDTITGNPTVDGCAQLPASIVTHAGLEPAYRYLDPDPVSTDRTAPTAPGRPTADTGFPTVASLSWPASQDDTGVTGYAIYRDGVLVGASTGPHALIPGLTVGATYSFTVTARDGAGNESPQGPPAVVTLPSADNVARGKTARASSEFSGDYSADKAVDGSTSTRWAQGAGLPDPSWLQVDLGAQYDVSGTITTFEKAGGYKYRIEVSPDEAHWTTLEDHTGAATDEATVYSPASSPITGRFVRLTVTDSNWNGGSVYELEVYGSALPPSTDHQAPTAPGQPTVTPVLAGVADVAWPAATDDTAVTNYEVFQDGRRIAVTDRTTLRVTGLKPQSDHTFTVVARDAALNESPASPEAHFTMPVPVNLALNRSARASSEFSGDYSADKAVDGSTSTRWAQGSRLPDPSWLEVDLGSVRQISTVATTFELSSGYRYRVEYSADDAADPDPASWRTLEDHTSAATGDQTAYSIREDAVLARHVRITVTDSDGNGGSIYELGVYGTF